jgi:hypothetical protein
MMSTSVSARGKVTLPNAQNTHALQLSDRSRLLLSVGTSKTFIAVRIVCEMRIGVHGELKSPPVLGGPWEWKSCCWLWGRTQGIFADPWATVWVCGTIGAVLTRDLMTYLFEC